METDSASVAGWVVHTPLCRKTIRAVFVTRETKSSWWLFCSKSWVITDLRQDNLDITQQQPPWRGLRGSQWTLPTVRLGDGDEGSSNDNTADP